MQAFFAAHWLDIFLLIVLAYYAADGYFRGAIVLALETAGFFVALVISLLAYRFVGAFIESKFSIPHSFAAAIGFFAVWAAVDLLWPLVIRLVWRRLPEKWRASRWNRRLGILPGLANGILLLSVLLTIALAFPLPSAIKKQVTESPVARPMIALAAGMDAAMKPIFGPLADQSINLLTVHPGSGETVLLHFTVADGTPDPESEQAMLALVNGERRKRGLAELRWSTALRDVARAHSDDMFRHGYFSHIDLEGRSPADRLVAAGIPFQVMGENLALAPTLEIAHDGLMNSPGHRANILNPDYRKIGIGIIDGGVYGKMFTQEFTN